MTQSLKQRSRWGGPVFIGDKESRCAGGGPGGCSHKTSFDAVEAECKEDPEGLALTLAEKGVILAALEAAKSAGS
ncbi:hypothetical protein Tco_0415699 [Tanacetum coccineum]